VLDRLDLSIVDRDGYDCDRTVGEGIAVMADGQEPHPHAADRKQLGDGRLNLGAASANASGGCALTSTTT
jgi:hypothetical protein